MSTSCVNRGALAGSLCVIVSLGGMDAVSSAHENNGGLGLVRFARTKGDVCVALLHGERVIFARVLHKMHDICTDVATVSSGFKRFQAILIF